MSCLLKQFKGFNVRCVTMFPVCSIRKWCEWWIKSLQQNILSTPNTNLINMRKMDSTWHPIISTWSTLIYDAQSFQHRVLSFNFEVQSFQLDVQLPRYSILKPNLYCLQTQTTLIGFCLWRSFCQEMKIVCYHQKGDELLQWISHFESLVITKFIVLKA